MVWTTACLWKEFDVTTLSQQSKATVRPRADRDLNKCAEVLRQVYRTDGYPVEGVDDALAWLQPPGLLHAWVAQLEGAILGHVAITEPGPTDAAPKFLLARSPNAHNRIAVLGRLFVTSTARGLALGEQLAKAALSQAIVERRQLVLDVMEKDRAAIRLYERLGWSQIGTTCHVYGHVQQATAFCYVAPILNSKD